MDLGTLPRVAELGGQLVLPPVPGANYLLADGDGALRQGPLDGGAKITLNLEGEWLLRVFDKSGVIAAFPFYVDIPPPTDNLLPALPTPTPTPEAARSALVDLFAIIRDAYGMSMWNPDPAADIAAQGLLAFSPREASTVVQEMGLSQPVHVWSCTAPTIEACADAVVWDPRQRHPLLSPDFRHFGAATSVEAGKVRVRLVITGE
jgi:hypothetical protein